MVKVVNEQPDPKVVKQIVCKSCGVTLEYLPIEVKVYNGTDYGGGPEGHEWIDCPQCQNKVILKSW